MNNTDIRGQFKQLRDQNPSAAEIQALKQRVFARIDTEAIPSPISVFTLRTYFSKALAAGGTLVVILFALHAGASTLALAPVSAQIALAPHAYAKSEVAVSALSAASDAYRSDPSAYNAEVLSALVTKSRHELDTLKLMGEPGKYTMDQCLSAYRQYYEIIDRLKDLVESPATMQGAASDLKLGAVVRDAEAEARARMGAYPREVQQKVLD
jgi:hypothetical protein